MLWLPGCLDLGFRQLSLSFVTSFDLTIHQTNEWEQKRLGRGNKYSTKWVTCYHHSNKKRTFYWLELKLFTLINNNLSTPLSALPTHPHTHTTHSWGSQLQRRRTTTHSNKHTVRLMGTLTAPSEQAKFEQGSGQTCTLNFIKWPSMSMSPMPSWVYTGEVVTCLYFFFQA